MLHTAPILIFNINAQNFLDTRCTCSGTLGTLLGRGREPLVPEELKNGATFLATDSQSYTSRLCKNEIFL